MPPWLKRFIRSLIETKVIPEDQEAAALKALNDLEIPDDEDDDPPPALSGDANAQLAAQISQLVDKRMNRALGPVAESIQALAKRLDDESGTRKSEAERAAATAKANREKEVETLLTEAVKSGRISAGEEEKTRWTKRLTGADAEEWQAELTAKPAKSGTEKPGEKPAGEKPDDKPVYESRLARSVPPGIMKHVEATIEQ